VLGWMQRADCLMVDGTLWRDDEMQRVRVGPTGQRHGPPGAKRARRHARSAGRLPRQRKVLIHINNTNPILDEDSAERALLERRGVEVAYDGMSIEL
jgi:pyrroloquinoline quinone biosynthesis protein B